MTPLRIAFACVAIFGVFGLRHDVPGDDLFLTHLGMTVAGAALLFITSWRSA